MRRWLGVAALLCACGGGDGDGAGDGGLAPGPGGPLGASLDGVEMVDCAWFESDDNCVAEVYRALDDCLPNGIITDDRDIENPRGVITDELSLCTYPDGSTVHFTPPVPDIRTRSGTMLPFGAYDWAFEVRDPAGELCFAYDDQAKPEELRVRGGVLRTAIALPDPTDAGSAIEVITCPDGRKVGTPALIGACEGGSVRGGFFGAGNWISYSMSGPGRDPTQAWLCFYEP